MHISMVLVMGWELGNLRVPNTSAQWGFSDVGMLKPRGAMGPGVGGYIYTTVHTTYYYCYYYQY